MIRPPALTQDAAGPRDPAAQTPALTDGARRRTSHVDVGPGDGGRWTDRVVTLEVRGEVRDVRRDGAELVVADGATLSARLDADRTLERVELAPSLDTSTLVGGPVGGGFRGSALELVDDVAAPHGVLLRDLPTAVVILAGYARMRSLQEDGVPGGKLTPPALLEGMADVCSGWRSGGVMAASIARGAGVPFQDCPPAPDLGGGWHDLGELSTDWMRRRRRIDLIQVAGGWSIDAMFRDSFASPQGSEEVLHEYAVTGVLADDLTVTSIEASPRVLPFVECPWAAENVTRLAGTPVGELRAVVGDRLAGTAGCTHMNDLIVALADVPRLVTPPSAPRVR